MFNLEKNQIIQKVKKWGKFSTPLETLSFIGFLFLLPLPIIMLPFRLSAPLLERFIPQRASYTGLIIDQLFLGRASFFNYVSPFDGKLWNWMFEAPIYHTIVANLMRTGLDLNTSARLVTLIAFLLGFIFFILIIKNFFEKRLVLWASVFYLIIPTHLFYARACQPDFTAHLFMLISGYSLCNFFFKSKYIWFILFVVSGTIGGLTKATVWFAPVLGLGIFNLWLFFKHRNLKAILVIVGLLMEVFLVTLWFIWASKMRFDSLVLTDHPWWFFGEIFLRFDVGYWLSNLRYFSFLTLGTGFLIPFFLGLFTIREKPLLISLLLMMILIPTLVLFNVHARHGWYQIPDVPYILVIVLFGIKKLFSLKQKWLVFCLVCLMGLPFARLLVTLKYNVTHIFNDWEPYLNLPKGIMRLTDFNELVFVTDGGVDLDVPLYSRRLVLLPIMNQNARKEVVNGILGKPDGLNPSVIVMKDNDVELLSFYDEIIIQDIILSFVPYIVYRVKRHENFPFDENSQFLLTNRIYDKPFRVLHKGEINLCNFNSGDWYKIPDKINEISIYGNNIHFKLPKKKIIYIPKNSRLGCKLQIDLL